jgi:hypothetical protein
VPRTKNQRPRQNTAAPRSDGKRQQVGTVVLDVAGPGTSPTAQQVAIRTVCPKVADDMLGQVIADDRGAAGPGAQERAASSLVPLIQDTKRHFIEHTVEFWQPRYSGKLTREDGRQIIENVTGFFHILLEWETDAQRAAIASAKTQSMASASKEGRPA